MEHVGHVLPACARANPLAEAGEAFTDETLKTQQHIFLTSPPGVGKTTMIRRLLERLRKDAGEDATNVTGFYTEEVRDAKGLRIGFDVVCIGAKQGWQYVRCSLARLGQDPPRIGKYTVNVAAFEENVVPVLQLAVPLRDNPGSYTASDGTQEVVSFRREEQGDACKLQIPSQGQQATMETFQPELVREVVDTIPRKYESSKPRLCICDEVGKMALLSSKFPSVLHAALDSGAVVLGTLPQSAKGQRDHEQVERVKKRADVRVIRLTRGNRDVVVESVYDLLRRSLAVDGARRTSPVVHMCEKNGDIHTTRVATGDVLLPEVATSGDAGLAKIAATELSLPEVSMACGRVRMDPQDKFVGETKAAGTAVGVAVKMTKLKDKEAKAKEQAKNREMAAKRAREGRKLRAEARKKARELAKSGVAVGVEEDGPDMEVFEDDDKELVEELSYSVEDVIDRDGDANVKAMDVVLDVDKPLGMVSRTASRENQQPPRRVARVSLRSSTAPRGDAISARSLPVADSYVLSDDG